jgi:hypothetical protein
MYSSCIWLTAAADRRAGVAPATRQREQWKDIDAENQDNPLACSEYAQQIFEYLNSAEVRSHDVVVSSRAAAAVQAATASKDRTPATPGRQLAAVQTEQAADSSLS